MYNFMSTVDHRLLFLTGIALMAVRLCLLVIGIKLVWKWLVPDLFPGLAMEGKVAKDISYKTAVKVMLGLAILAFLVKPASFISYTDKSDHMAASRVLAPEKIVRYKGLVICTPVSNEVALISSLQEHSPDIARAEISLRLILKDPHENVLKALEWAEANAVKVIIIDGNLANSADARVKAKIKAMSKAGFSLREGEKGPVNFF